MTDLQQRSRENLIRFLRTELDIAQTFREIAEGTDRAEHRAQLVDKIRVVVETVRHFEGKVDDEEVRRQIAERVEVLEKYLAQSHR